MAEFTLKYFSDSDTISSSDYNDNVDAINNGTYSIGSVNVRDQGLDVWNFKNETAVVDYYDYQVSVEKKKFLFDANAGNRVSSSELTLKLPTLNLLSESDVTAFPVEKKSPELVAVFRCNFEYLLSLLATQDAVTVEHAFLRIKVQFKIEGTLPNGNPMVPFWMPQMERTITFYGKQLAMKRGYGNIGISSVIRKEDMQQYQQGIYSDFKIIPYFSVAQNPASIANYFDENSGLWDNPDAANDNYKLRLDIENFISNITLYRRAL